MRIPAKSLRFFRRGPERAGMTRDWETHACQPGKQHRRSLFARFMLRSPPKIIANYSFSAPDLTRLARAPTLRGFVAERRQNKMSRRKQSPFEDLIEITAKFPWWVGVVLAVVSYLLLHYFATKEIVVTADIKGLNDSIGKQFLKASAMIGQYVLPVVFLAGSLASAFGRRKREALHTSTATRDGALEAMSWQEFELLVGEFFRKRGFTVEETGGGGADGGVDLVIAQGNDRYVVQCKKWKAQQVGVSTVRELYGVMTAQGAVGGFVVTSGAFTEDARRFAEGREIELVACDQLLAMIREQHSDTASIKATTPAAAAAPSCPQCNSTMILRTARKGTQVGSSFWGCPKYPGCRGTRPV